MNSLVIRPALPADFPAMWDIFRDVVAAGDTYAFDVDTPAAVAEAYWFGPGILSCVIEHKGAVVGMYKLCQNAVGRGNHVANASFMVSPRARGLGIGRLLGEHCLDAAREAGYLAMQFNYVVSSNAPAVALWESLGFQVVGTLPLAFRHARRGYVDALVMYRTLSDPASWPPPEH
ncbi:GNAT family N-acetyltransferase [Massilia sp. TS11]|uniref:GNAT family N-acetyltransferase n=1 Tax=Massilia sp. TS11 TaxID=2908003 RepID=UPI001EDAB8FA|nr:N-acetyltransferase [Massilia sp. TS11]MCG2583713.1 GNAT family N-acetyltransferase [Massilia sp. TS11]